MHPAITGIRISSRWVKFSKLSLIKLPGVKQNEESNNVGISVFISLAGIALAQSGGVPEWISGEVSSIYEDEDGAVMSLEMADGEPYNVSVDKDMIKSISVGDVVTVQIYKGWAELIERADIKPQATPEPNKKKSGAQWVAGTLVSVEKGPKDSLLSIRLSNDKVFNVSASNDKVAGIKPGDYLTVKILKGWAQSVTKK